MQSTNELIERVRKTTQGFTDIRRAADELRADHTPAECIALAHELYPSEVHQARMLATYLLGDQAAHDASSLAFLRETVSRDDSWQVQEILAQAFDAYCKAIGYETALPVIEAWLADEHPNVRRAVTEGLRIWTARPYFKEHPDAAIRLLSQHRADASEYLRKSVGNALRDISRQHADLVRAELATWDTSDKRVAYTYKLAAKFLG